jgi:hypothetical protein
MASKKLGIKEDIKNLCENKQIIELVFMEITNQGKIDGLFGF